MRPTPIHKGTIQRSKIHFDDGQKYRLHLATFREGDRVEVVVRKERNQRTIQQNRYYWGVVLAVISEETGHTTSELHWFFKNKFLPKVEMTAFDKRFKIPRSTTDLSTEDFTEYIRKIKRFAASELDCFIPDADEVEI